MLISPQSPNRTDRRSIDGLAADLVDARLADLLIQTEGTPTKIWSLLNRAAAAALPRDRKQRDNWRLWAWKQLQRLIQARVVQRRGAWVCLGSVPIPPNVGRGSTSSRSQMPKPSCDAARRISRQTGQTPSSAQPENQKRISATPRSVDESNAMARGQSDPPQRPEKPCPEPHQAARTLAAYRWQYGRRLTGKVGDRRVHLGQAVLFSDDREARVLFAMRGNVILEIGDAADFENCVLTVARIDKLRVTKDTSAVALGQRKRGIREQFSNRKAQTSRRNGSSPVRPGRRPRGRPLRLASTLSDATTQAGAVSAST